MVSSCPHWVICDRVEPAASPAMSAMPPKAEVNSEHSRKRHRPLRVDGAARDVIQALKPEPRIMRHELSDQEWTAIKPMLPNKPRGVQRVDDCRVLNGMVPTRKIRPQPNGWSRLETTFRRSDPPMELLASFVQLLPKRQAIGR